MIQTRRAFLTAALACSLVGQASAGESKGKQIAVAVFVVPERGTMSRATRATLVLTMESALEDNRGLHIVDVDARLADRAGRVPWDEITAARAKFDAGQRALDRGRAAQALPDLEAAAAALEAALAHLDGMDELARAQFAVGAAHVSAGNSKRARAALQKLASWRPDYSYPDISKQPDVEAAWRAAKGDLEKKQRGSLALETQPAGALAYVDGRFVGFTPTTVEDLAAGVHYVTYKMPGFYPATVAARAQKRKPPQVTATLEPAARADQVGGLVSAVAATLDSEEAPRALLDLRDLLGIEHAIFVRVPSIEAEDGTYVAAVFDAASRRRLAVVSAAADDDIQSLFQNLARSLYANIRLVTDVDTTDRDRSMTRKRPVYKRWWFWTGLTLTTAAAVGVPLYLMRDGGGDSRCPAGSTCGQVTWSF